MHTKEKRRSNVRGRLALWSRSSLTFVAVGVTLLPIPWIAFERIRQPLPATFQLSTEAIL